MENTTNKKEFINRFLSDNLTGMRDAYGFQYDVYATVKRDLTDLGFDRSLQSTKDLTDVIKHIFFAFVSGGYEIESVEEYINYLPELYPDYDLENKESLVYEALSICTNITTNELFNSFIKYRKESSFIIFKQFICF